MPIVGSLICRARQAGVILQFWRCLQQKQAMGSSLNTQPMGLLLSGTGSEQDRAYGVRSWDDIVCDGNQNRLFNHLEVAKPRGRMRLCGFFHLGLRNHLTLNHRTFWLMA